MPVARTCHTRIISGLIGSSGMSEYVRIWTVITILYSIQNALRNKNVKLLCPLGKHNLINNDLCKYHFALSCYKQLVVTVF